MRPFQLPRMTRHLHGNAYALATDLFVNAMRRFLSRWAPDHV